MAGIVSCCHAATRAQHCYAHIAVAEQAVWASTHARAQDRHPNCMHPHAKLQTVTTLWTEALALLGAQAPQLYPCEPLFCVWISRAICKCPSSI